MGKKKRTHAKIPCRMAFLIADYTSFMVVIYLLLSISWINVINNPTLLKDPAIKLIFTSIGCLLITVFSVFISILFF